MIRTKQLIVSHRIGLIPQFSGDAEVLDSVILRSEVTGKLVGYLVSFAKHDSPAGYIVLSCEDGEYPIIGVRSCTLVAEERSCYLDEKLISFVFALVLSVGIVSAPVYAASPGISATGNAADFSDFIVAD